DNALVRWPEPAIPLGSLQRHKYADLQRSDRPTQPVSRADLRQLYLAAQSATRNAVRIALRILGSSQPSPPERAISPAVLVFGELLHRGTRREPLLPSVVAAFSSLCYSKTPRG